MRKLVLIIFALTIACSTPEKKEKPVKSVTPREKVETIKVSKSTGIQGNIDSVAIVQIEVIEQLEELEEIDNTIIFIKKSPCSGDCPEYEVVISKDSILSYTGINSVSLLGTHTFKLTNESFIKLEEKLEKFTFPLKDTIYGAEASDEFPRTTIIHQKKSATIKLWKDAPEKLIDVYTFIEDILYDQKYLEE